MVTAKDLKGLKVGKRFIFENKDEGLSAEIISVNGYYEVYVNSLRVVVDKSIKKPLIELNKAIKTYKLKLC